jgi:hypothetical protein
MHSTPITLKIVELIAKEEQEAKALQNEYTRSRRCPSVQKSDFFIKTLANLQVFNDTHINNVQLRELYHYRQKMLKHMIAEVSLQLMKFKNCVQAYYTKFNTKNPF